MLEAAGFTVAEAATGAEATQAARTVRPGLVLLDIQLPDVDGFEVARRLAADPAGGPAPVVVLTSTREASDYGGRTGGTLPLGTASCFGVAGACLAAAATSVRLDTPSLARTDETWWSTVFGEITSLVAMPALVRPSQSNSSTSCSRWVRPSGFSRVAARCPAGTDRMPSERIFWRMIRAVATAPSASQMSSARRSASSSGASSSASAAS